MDKTYDVTSAFSKINIEVEGGVNLEIAYGEEVSVSYTESDQEKFEIAEDAETLKIKQTRTVQANLVKYKSKSLKIVVPLQNKITLLEIVVDGAMDCKLVGDYENIDFKVNGALDADINGSAQKFVLDCNGAANVENKSFVVEKATLSCDGAINFEFVCNKELSVVSNGTCSGVYYGACTVTKTINGTGSIKQG